MNADHSTISDEDLTAFMDGEADADVSARVSQALLEDNELAARATAMQGAIGSVNAALDLKTLGAPDMPAHLLAQTGANDAGWTMPKSRVLLPLALAASFLIGVVVTSVLRPSTTGWIDQVASYQALYVTETISGPPQEEAIVTATFAKTGSSLGHSLEAAPVIEGMTFKRVQVLAIGGQPLFQLAYLGDDGTPYALCIKRVSGEDHPPRARTSHKLAAASWVEDGIGFLLIGGSQESRISELAQGLAATL